MLASTAERRFPACSGVRTMDTIVLLITFSAGMLAVRYKEHLRLFAPAPASGSRVLVDQVLGLSRLELPRGWRQARDLNETASIEAINALHGRHVIVISDAIEDFVPEMTVFEHSLNTRAELTNNIRLISCSGPDRRIVGGYESVQYEIEGFFQQTRIKYLHTTVAGRRAFHQVLAWSTCSRYDRAAFEDLLNGFAELTPGREAEELPTPTEPLQVIPHSQYDVH
jgi:dihydrofolate reductase